MANSLDSLSDLEIVLGIVGHIEHPCSTCIKGIEYNLRDFYLRIAKDLIPELRNEPAKEFLSAIIKIYE